MRRISIWIPVVAFLLGSSLAAGESLPTAGPKTVFASASGNDANPCTRTQPCRTLAAAVAAVATGGEVVVLDSGSFGTVVIFKSLTIEAAPGVYAGINATSSDGIDVQVGATDKVVLRGLTIYGSAGSTNGIYFLSAGALHVENCVIQGFPSQGIQASMGGHLIVRDTVFRNMGTGGALLDAPPAAEGLVASFDHCRFENNGSNGLQSRFGVKVAIRDSIASGNINGFLSSFGMAASNMAIENCLVENNSGVGVGFESVGSEGGTIRLSGSTVTGNGIGLQGPSVGSFDVFESFGNNHVRGNTTNISGPITPVNND